MTEAGRAGGYRPSSPPAATLSPLVKALPTGYRDLQPFQRGQGWHSNGRPKRSKPSPRQLRACEQQHRSPERVVFPVIQSLEARSWTEDRRGPNTDDLDDEVDRERAGEVDERSTEDGEPLPSPHSEDPVVSVTFRPLTPQHLSKTASTPPSAPRRPVTVGGEPHTTTSFRARVLASSRSTTSSDSSMGNSPSIADVPGPSEPKMKDVAVQSSLGDRPKRSTGPKSIAELIHSEEASAPVPEVVQQLWHEFNDRVQAQRVIDKDEYHRKAQRKYTERAVLREQVAQLQNSLTTTRRERNSLLQRLGPDSTDELELGGGGESLRGAPSPHRSPNPSSRAAFGPENAYTSRERSFQLERALADTKQQLVDTEERLIERQTALQGEIDGLNARLELERRANAMLASQLRETASGFQTTTDELVGTRVELEREQVGRLEDRERFEDHTQQLSMGHRREMAIAKASQALLTLGRQALRDKLKTFHSRAMVAEQRMRVAIEEASRLKLEVNSKQRSLEQLMASVALGKAIPSLNSSPATCMTESVLSHGFTTISGRVYLLQVVVEDAEAFNVHFVTLDPASKQHDRLSFGLPDIRRLVTDYSSYLDKSELGYRQRLGSLATLLLQHVHAGFKSGRLVLCEVPTLQASSSSSYDALEPSETPATREVAVYRGTTAIVCGDRGPSETGAIIADVTVNEVYSTAARDRWWVEIHAVFVDGLFGPTDEDWEQQDEYVLKVDRQQLVGLSDGFASYRPSDRLDKLPSDDLYGQMELMAVHEAMLQPLLDRLQVFKTDERPALRLGLSVDPAPLSTQADKVVPEATEPPEGSGAAEDGAEAAGPSAKPSSRTLDHRSIVRIGGVFYCARFLELWDDELLLQVTLDDPEASVRVTGVLNQQHLAAIAVYLHAQGVLDRNFAPMLEVGITAELQLPLCKLLTKHLRKSRVDRWSPLGVSFSSLLQEIGFSGGEGDSQLSIPTSSHGEPMVQPLTVQSGDVMALGCLGRVSEEQVRRLLQQSKTPEAYSLRQSRRGVWLRTESGRRELTLLHIFEGFAGFDGFLAVCYPLEPVGDTKRPRMVAVNESFGPKALQLLGVERQAE